MYYILAICLAAILIMICFIRPYGESFESPGQFLTIYTSPAYLDSLAKYRPPVVLPNIVDDVPIIAEKSMSISPVNISAAGISNVVSVRRLPQFLMLTNIAQHPVNLSAPIIFDTVSKSAGNAITAIIHPTYTAIRLLPGYVYKCTAKIPWATVDVVYTWYADKPFGAVGLWVSNIDVHSIGYIQNNTNAPIYIFLVCIQSINMLTDLLYIAKGYTITQKPYIAGDPTKYAMPWALIEAIHIL